MTEPMRVLYQYTMDSTFQALLHSDRFHLRQLEATQLEAQLCRELSDRQRALFDRYQAALTEQQHLELEAMFQSAFALRRELG